MGSKEETKMNYEYYKNKWKKFFMEKGFQIHYEDENLKRKEWFVSLRNKDIVIEIYAGYYRTDTNTGGCICADYIDKYNKVSQCPVYFDLNESDELVWKAIEILMNSGNNYDFYKIVKNENNDLIFLK
jgi:hypothetical protein